MWHCLSPENPIQRSNQASNPIGSSFWASLSVSPPLYYFFSRTYASSDPHYHLTRFLHSSLLVSGPSVLTLSTSNSVILHTSSRVVLLKCEFDHMLHKASQWSLTYHIAPSTWHSIHPPALTGCPLHAIPASPPTVSSLSLQIPP